MAGTSGENLLSAGGAAFLTSSQKNLTGDGRSVKINQE